MVAGLSMELCFLSGIQPNFIQNLNRIMLIDVQYIIISSFS